MDQNKVVVGIPIYKTVLTETELISLKQVKQILGKYPMVFIAPYSLNINFEMDDNKLKVERFSDKYFLNTSTYSKLLLSEKFYERFINYKFLLIYQLDAFVFNDKLLYFCKLNYDYIGAPMGYVRQKKKWDGWIGNGGFSLRKIKSIISLLKKMKNFRKKNPKLNGEWELLEDQFFAFCGRYKIEGFSVPSVDVALEFSFDSDVKQCYRRNQKKMPFGCHAWNKNDIAFYKEKIESFGHSMDTVLLNNMGMADYQRHIDQIKPYLWNRHKRRLKIIGFGTGKILQHCYGKFSLESIEFFVDNKNLTEYIYNKKILKPDELKNFEYDYIVIFSTRFFKEMYFQLLSLGISKNKILSWRFFLEEGLLESDFCSFATMKYMMKIIHMMNFHHILDINMCLEKNHIYNIKNEEIFFTTNKCFDGINLFKKEVLPIYQNTYRSIFSDFNECLNKKYDVIIFHNAFVDENICFWENKIKATMNISRYILINIPYAYNILGDQWFRYDFSQFGKIEIFPESDSFIILIDKMGECRARKNHIKIFVATHKVFDPPASNMYIPIHAGKRIHTSLGYKGDDSGENISELNLQINECTVLYWMWKNVNCKYIGLNHYRRYFSKNKFLNTDNIIDENDVDEILNEYDIILGDAYSSYPDKVSDVMKNSICEKAYENGLYVIRQILHNKCPEYLAIFEYLMDGYTFYRCNLFVTRKETIDKYCEWIFNIIIEAAQRMNIEEYDVYDKRVIGFFAERLFSVWILKQNLKVKELPIITIDN